MRHRFGTMALAIGLAWPALANQPVNQAVSSIKPEPGARAKVTAIFISVVLPDGKVQNFSFDPAKVEALFFTERSVSDMLGRFYDQLPGRKTLPAEVLLKRYGTQQSHILLSGETSLPLSRQSLTTLWTTPNASGVLPAFITKDPDCMPGGDP